MQTAKALIVNPDQDTSLETRIFFDCGSQRSFITEDLCKKLCLSPIGEETLSVCTFGTKETKDFRSKLVKLDVMTLKNRPMRIKVNTIPCITHDMARNRLPFADAADYHSLQLADDYFSEQGEYSIQLLIGNDYYFKFVLSERRPMKDGLFLVSTRLGWMLTGSVEGNSACTPVVTASPITFATTALVRVGNPESNGTTERHFTQILRESDKNALLTSSTVLFQDCLLEQELKNSNELTIDSSTTVASKTTFCATICKTTPAEESVSALMTSEQIRVTPFVTTSVPMFRTATVNVEVKFLNGIQRRWSNPVTARSFGVNSTSVEKEAYSDRVVYSRKNEFRTVRTSKFETESCVNERRAVFIEPVPSLGYTLTSDRELDATMLNRKFSRKQPHREPSGMSAWSRRVPLKSAS